MPTRVKICCIASRAEADLAIRAGADALGLVGPMPSGPGVINLDQAAAIARDLPPAVSSFLLSSRTDAEGLAEEAALVAPATLQICDDVEDGAHAELRRRFPAMRLAQVIHVEDETAIERARAAAPHVHGLLLDSGRPKAALPELGGTGRRHDWRISRRIVEQVRLPVFLAGGLEPANLREALTTVRPFGVDVCSGVRRDGRLDRERLAAFMNAAGRG